MIEQFHRPATVREALALKRRYRSRAAFLAGGTYLKSNETRLHPTHCISLGALPLDRIGLERGRVTIGARCTLQQLVDDRKVPGALRDAALQVVSRNVRNMATLGGHVALHPPYSDVLPMLMALEASVAVAGPGAARLVPVAAYLARPAPGLITRIVVPRPAPGRAFACRNFRLSANARSLVTAAVSVTLARHEIADPIVALGGLSRHAVRLGGVEKALAGRPLPPDEELRARVARGVRPSGSGRTAPITGAAFLRHQAAAIVALALAAACRPKGDRR